MGSSIGANIRRLREERGWSQSRLAREVCRAAGVVGDPVGRQEISRWETGKRTPREWLPFLAAALGVPVDALKEPEEPAELPFPNLELAGDSEGVAPQRGEVVSVNRRTFVSATTAALSVSATRLNRGQRVIQALEVMNEDSANMLPVALGELIDHYTLTIYSTPPADVYDELLTVRAYASGFLDTAMTERQRKEVTLSVGWLSCLLGIAGCDMGAHAAAHIWCSDAERRSQEVGHPELSGWAVLTKSLIAFYQGRPHQSVTLASQGQGATSSGTLIHTKLATQEIRKKQGATPRWKWINCLLM